MVSVACSTKESPRDQDLRQLLQGMTVEQKLGQLQMVHPDAQLDTLILQGRVGAVLNVTDPKEISRLQQLAQSVDPGIPLLVARDVIHGYRTIFPVPIGMAATWNPELVEAGAAIAAHEAASQGINWTFSPMMDVTRDPRWGRVVETFGEDPYLSARMAAAMVSGYQGSNLASPYSIAACAKHFLAYGWAEGGRDYNSANIPDNDVYDIVLPPFTAAMESGVATVMTAFQDINGIPATAHPDWLKRLRQDMGFHGLVVSDWESIPQLVVHGYATDFAEAARQSLQVGVDMEMQSRTYFEHLTNQVTKDPALQKALDSAVLRVLQLKKKLGLFDSNRTEADFKPLLDSTHLAAAQQAAAESFVLLQNEGAALPLRPATRILLTGPLADAPHDQLGTWVFDGDKDDAITPRMALSGLPNVAFSTGLPISRSRDQESIRQAVAKAADAEVIVVCLGEEAIITGESHSRADISLPGAQQQLVEALHATGKPIIAVVLAGRPLTIESILPYTDAVLYAFHPGTMTGPALAQLLFGEVNPSGKLPITFPRHVGQIPLYYNHRNTGKPATPASFLPFDSIPTLSPQTSVGNTSLYLDYGYAPLFPFGFGLSYTTFSYGMAQLEKAELTLTDTLRVTVQVTNTGLYDGHEVVQLYVRDLAGSRARPVRELKAFDKVFIPAGETITCTLSVPVSSLAFYTAHNRVETEPGDFHLWVGGSSDTGQPVPFTVKTQQP